MTRKTPLLGLLLGFVLLLQGCVIIPISLPTMPTDQMVMYKEGKGRDKVAIIDVSGVLTSGGASESFFGSDSSVVSLTKKLDVAREDKHVKAIILRVDSPGGGVTASDIMYRELMRFKQERDIPIYVSMQNLAASGGYYISMAGDRIYAHPTSITGSIGVIAMFPEVKGLMDMAGVKMNAIRTGEMKDAGAFYDHMTDAERELYTDVIQDMYSQFLAVIEKNRTNLTHDELLAAADGRIYTAKQALDKGLIDGVAYLDEVIEMAKKDVGKDPDVVLIMRSSREEVSTAYASSKAPETGGTQFNLFNMNLDTFGAPSTEVFQYMWRP
ncbi:signal peptide peptidase SppA [bacterium]|nr:signal peptide peptidase SppA [bacterium]